MHFGEGDWKRIEQFAGYGNERAPLVFVGMEEGLDPKTSLIEELRFRAGFSEIMDLYEAHGATGDDFVKTPGRRPTWIAMSYLAIHFLTRRAASYEECREYMVRRLGRKDGETLLIDLMPYPNTNTNEWNYLERFPDRLRYFEKIRPARAQLLKALIARTKRELIVCYGKKYWDHYRDLFPGSNDWKSDQYCVSTSSHGARVVMTPHFTWNAFNGDSGLAKLADCALE